MLLTFNIIKTYHRNIVTLLPNMPQALPRTIRIKSTHFHGLQNACMGSGRHPPLSLTPSGITFSTICYALAQGSANDGLPQ